MVQIARGKFNSSASHASLLRKHKKSNEKYIKKKKSKARGNSETGAEAEVIVNLIDRYQNVEDSRTKVIF